jgi:hypothetical protein
MIEFMRGSRTPLGTIVILASVRMASNSGGYLASRSRIKSFDAAACVLQVHDQVAGGLGDPGCGGVGGGAQDPDPSAGVLDHREDVHPGPGQRHRLDEVGREQGSSLGAQEGRPRGGGPFWGRVDAGLVEDLPDRRRSDRHRQDEEFAVDAPVPTGGVFPGQA